MTVEEGVAGIRELLKVELRVLQAEYTSLNEKIDAIRADLHQHRIEAASALAMCNSRIDNLTSWMVGGLGAAVLALFAAVASWFTPRPH